MRRTLALALAALAVSALLPASAGASADGELPDIDALDPVVLDCPDADPVEPGTQGIEACDAVIVETAIVPTRSGARIFLDIIRPRIDGGVPAIMMASPYYNTLGRGWRGELKAPTAGPSNPFRPATTALGGGRTEVGFPEWYDEYFVPRGYAYVAMDLRGSRNSSGCQVYGDRDEILDAVDVVDWIADQGWSNGKVGMTGGSYDGTIAIGAAAEAPRSARHRDALAAIIPIRSIGRWYDYHFFNGVQSSSHQATAALFSQVLQPIDVPNSAGEDVLAPLVLAEREACVGTVSAVNTAGYASPYQDARAPFWNERDYTTQGRAIRAATFIISGLFDYNVKAHNVGYLWDELPADGPHRMWLANMDHNDPHVPTTQDAGSKVMPFPFQERYIEANHRWWAQFLKGIETGVLDEPRFEVQRGDGTWTTGDAFPAAQEDLVLNLSTEAVDGGGYVATPDASAAQAGTLAYRDRQGSSAPQRIVFQTAPFEQDTRISGQIAFDLDLAASGQDATTAVEVKMLPPGSEPGTAAGIVHDGERPVTISYGWLRAYYRDSVPLRGLSTPTGGSFTTPGEVFDARFGGIHTDVVVPEGWTLAFEVSASDGGTVASGMSERVSLLTGPDASRILVPVAPAS